MREYFHLQFKMINRQMSDAGIAPLAGWLLMGAAFGGLSAYLFQQVEWAVYVFLLAALGVLSKLSEPRRNDFLKTCFNAQHYKNLRILENLILALPFILVLLIYQEFAVAAFLGGISVIMGLLSFKSTLSFTIPTPFGSRPFEFLVGFRTTFFLFPVAYIFSVIAVTVDNMNLGIFGLLMIFLVVMSYYPRPENEFYVWCFSLSPHRFLREKIVTALWFTFLLSAPMVLLLSIFYIENLGLILSFYGLGFVFPGLVILAKYSVYPREMNLPEIVLMILSIYFLPLLPVVFLWFYSKAIRHLKPILD